MGGMSEKVTDGVNGMFFRRGDPDSLAEVMRRAAGDSRLWKTLRAGIPPVQTMREHVTHLEGLYRDLLDQPPNRGGLGRGRVLSHA
jgi:hypothetical protein